MAGSIGARVRPGISVLLDERRDLLAGRRVGVLTGPSGVLPDLTGSAEALLHVADVRALFGPEHGLLGASAEAARVSDGVHRSGVPIYSLYGQQLVPTREQFADLDVVVCDLQDIGCRFYTYAWTLIKLMQAAASVGVAVIIADRPNPLGAAVEGPGVEAAHRTLVGLHDVPIRHGLTLGELARLVDAELAIGCDLTVVACQGWRRSMYWDAIGLPWVPPSPNMPTAAAALVYPGTCLSEGVNLSVGRGTARPFEWLGAPWVDGPALAAALNTMALPGVRWRPLAFEPYLAPYAGELCQGVQPYVTDPLVFRPVLSGVGLLAALRRTHPDTFTLSALGSIYADPEEMHRRMYDRQPDWASAHFDRLAGSPALRGAIEAGAAPGDIAAAWRPYEEAFHERAAPFQLYTT
jgi:uncharacterized protein YbbC (DUF1343 family)